LQEQRDRRSNVLEGIRKAVDKYEVLTYRPVGCFYLDEDPIHSRLAFFLSSILLSIYDQVPDVLRESAVNVVGLEPQKFDLVDNPLHVGAASYYYHVLTWFCSVCPLRGECPWLTVLRLLRPLFETQ